MGTPVPLSWPELKTGKYYCVTVDIFGGNGNGEGCDQPFYGTASCCKTGEAIQAWLDAGLECKTNYPLCYGVTHTAQRITCITGPYESESECGDFC